MKKLLLASLLALTAATPIGLADPAEKPKNPGKPIGKPPEFWVARRAELNARKEAQKERSRQFKADRVAAEEKMYQDWHDRYVADAPVREEYYRTQANTYQAEASANQARAAYFYAAGPPVVVQLSANNPSYTTSFPFTPSCCSSRSAFFGQTSWGW